MGTAAGDRLQRNAATTISENLRSEDVITRLQDGCFLIAFPGVGKEQVRTVLESLNQKLGKLDSMESIQLDWTIVSTPEDGTSIDALIARLRAAI